MLSYTNNKKEVKMLKHSCKNCEFCNFVYEYTDENGKTKWMESYIGQSENGKDMSPNSYRCMRFSAFGDKIENVFNENECDDYSEKKH